VKRRKGNREIIPVIKDHNGTIIVDTTEKANVLIPIMRPSFAAIVTSRKIQLANLGDTFIINTKVIRKRLAKIGKNKSVRS
jgi:hypothetical protein